MAVEMQNLNINTTNHTISSITQDYISSLAKENRSQCSNPNEQPFSPNLRGTIIPPEWKSITDKDGKKLSRGALELYATIVSWFTPKKIQDKNGVKLVSKLEDDELRRNYQYFMEILDRSQEQVRRYFVELKNANLISYEIKTITHNNWRYYNTLCIRLNKAAPHFSNNPSDKKIWPINHKKVGPSPQKSGASYIEETSIKTKEIDYLDLKESDFFRKNDILSVTRVTTETQQHRPIEIDVSFKNPIKDKKLTYDAKFEAYRENEHSENTEISCSSHSKSNDKQSRRKDAESNNGLRTPIAQFYPISKEDASYLRSASSRDFSHSYINKLLLKLISMKPDHGFYTKSLFLSYMTKVLSRELRNPTNTNNEDFQFARSKKTKTIESYLDKIESSNQIDKITQVQRKIIGRFEPNDAYLILTNLNFDANDQVVTVTREGRFYRDSMTFKGQEQIKITQIILDVFGKNTEVIFDDKSNHTKPKEMQQKQSRGDVIENTQKPKTFEQKILYLLKTHYGEALYQSWFSNVNFKLDDSSKLGKARVQILTPTAFHRSWIKTNYGHIVESIVSKVVRAQNYSLNGGGIDWAIDAV